MIINSVPLILDCHLYYCHGGILILCLLLLAGNKRRIEKKERRNLVV
jgi:hypothetical protein